MHLYRLKIYFLSIVLIGLGACTPKKESTQGDDEKDRLYPAAKIGTSGKGSSPKKQNTGAGSVSIATELTLGTAKVTIPPEALNSNAKLELEPLYGGFVERPNLKLVSAAIQFKATLDGAVVERDHVWKDLTIKLVTTKPIAASSIRVLLLTNPGTAKESNFILAPSMLTITKNSSNTYDVVFKTRETFSGFVLADTYGGVPSGYTVLTEPPPDPVALSAVANSPNSLTLTWASGGGSTKGWYLAYDLITSPPETCALGSSITPTDATIIDPDTGASRSGFIYDLEDLTDGGQYVLRVCSTNDRSPVDVSEGSDISLALPARAVASLQNAPRTYDYSTDLDIRVGGTDIIAYKYALGDDQTECSSATYSTAWIPVETKITDALGADGAKKLCVLGQISDSNEQLEATEHAWTKDTVAPGAFAITAPSTSHIKVTTQEITWEESTEAYTYSLMLTSDSSCQTKIVSLSGLTEVSKTLVNLSDNSYYLCLIAFDEAGNAKEASNSGQIILTVDTVVPGDFSITGPVANINTATPTVTWGTSDGASSYSIKIGSENTCSTELQTYTAITATSQALSALTEGTYYACVTATDLATNTKDASNLGYSFTVDLTPPVFTSVALANEAIDSYVNDSESVLTGDLIDTLTASGYDSVGYKLVTAATSCDGSLTYGTSIPASNSPDFGADGTYKVCIKLSDIAGNITYGSSANLTLDTTAPGFTSIDLVNDASDAYINAAEKLLNQDLVGNLNAASYDTVEYKLESSAATCDGSLSYDSSVPQGTSLDFGSDGAYKICLNLMDNAGNITYASSSSITLETTIPSFSSVDLANEALDSTINLADSGLGNDLVTNLTGSGYDTALYKLVTTATVCDNSLVYGATIPKANSADFAGDGNYKVCVKLSDAANNTPSYGSSSSLAYDVTAPSFTSIALVNDAADSYINLSESSETNALVGSLSASGYDTVEYKLVASGTNCDGLLTYGSMPLSDSADFSADGVFKVCIKLSDNAGNPAAYGSSSTLTRDIAPPMFTSVALAGDAADGYISAAESSNSAAVLDSIVASDYDQISYYLHYSTTTCDGSLGYGASVPGSNHPNFTVDGSFKVCIQLTDNAGNPAAYGETSVFVYDTTEGDSSVTTSGTLDSTSTGGANTTIAGTASDAKAGVASVEVSVQEGTGSCLNSAKSGFTATCPNWIGATGTTSWSLSVADSRFSNGVTYTVQSRMTDNAGNVETSIGSNTFDWSSLEGTSVWGSDVAKHSGNQEKALASAVDSAGNLYVVGYQTNSDRDWWLTKFDKDGVEDTINWNKVLDGGHGDDEARAIAIDSNDYIYVVGYKTGAANKNWWIKKYQTDGTEVTSGWDKEIDSASGNDDAFAVGVDTSGNVYVAGYGMNVATGIASNEDLWLKKFNSSGTEQCEFTEDPGTDNYSDALTSIVIDNPHSLIYAAGYQSTATAKTWWLGKLDFSCSKQLSQTYNGSGSDDQINSIALDSQGNIWAAGNTDHYSAYDWWLQKFNDNLSTQCQVRSDDAGSNEAHGIVIDSNDLVYVGGSKSDSNGNLWLRQFDSICNEDIGNWNKNIDGTGSNIDSVLGLSVSRGAGDQNNIYVIGFGTDIIGGSGEDWWIKKYYGQ